MRLINRIATSRRSIGKMIRISIGLGLMYWILDTLLDSLVFQSAGFLAMRLINWSILTGFAVYAQMMLQERKAAEEAVKKERDKAEQLIVEMKRSEQEREKLIRELQDALSEVRLLGSLLPICASCKKIRDDKGYWHQVEVYIGNRTGAQFSHGICPDCQKKYYEQLAEWTRAEDDLKTN